MTEKTKNQITEHFKISEFDCHDGTRVPETYYENLKELCENLEVLRLHIHRPINISSGYRTPAHNVKEKGSPKSQHLTASAADIWVKHLTPHELFTIIEYLIHDGKMKDGGLGCYETFVHYDIRGTKARW